MVLTPAHAQSRHDPSSQGVPREDCPGSGGQGLQRVCIGMVLHLLQSFVRGVQRETQLSPTRRGDILEHCKLFLSVVWPILWCLSGLAVVVAPRLHLAARGRRRRGDLLLLSRADPHGIQHLHLQVHRCSCVAWFGAAARQPTIILEEATILAACVVAVEPARSMARLAVAPFATTEGFASDRTIVCVVQVKAVGTKETRHRDLSGGAPAFNAVLRVFIWSATAILSTAIHIQPCRLTGRRLAILPAGTDAVHEAPPLTAAEALAVHGAIIPGQQLSVGNVAKLGRWRRQRR